MTRRHRTALVSGLAAATLLAAAPALAHPGGRGDMLEKIDADKNGRLSLAEIEAGADAMFARLDADQNGALDKADHEAMRAAMAAKAPEGAAPAERLAGKRMKRAERRAAHMDAVDVNKDGAVSLAEFKADAQRRFNAADADKSGDLDKTEFSAFHPKKGHRKAAPGTP